MLCRSCISGLHRGSGPRSPACRRCVPKSRNLLASPVLSRGIDLAKLPTTSISLPAWRSRKMSVKRRILSSKKLAKGKVTNAFPSGECDKQDLLTHPMQIGRATYIHDSNSWFPHSPQYPGSQTKCKNRRYRDRYWYLALRRRPKPAPHMPTHRIRPRFLRLPTTRSTPAKCVVPGSRHASPFSSL